jgi:RNA polymerase sigma factor (sigma-70 family)
MLPDLPIIVLTTFSETDLVIGAVQGGADGYLLKDVEVEELAQAIRTVKSGQPYLHPEATRHLLQATSRPLEQAPERLTKREQEVLTLLARGYTNRQIADSLTITEKTVSVHVSNLLNKLELTSRTQAALYATRVGLVVPEDAR